ncbi:MAG: TrkA C-terminal domain-containing protein, partial [Gemmatimonadales bacterium]
FFVSVGLLIDPALVARHWDAVVLLSGVVILGKVVSVALGAFLTGSGTRTAIQAGMSLAQIGEFSFIIAGLGLALGATGDFLYPVAVAVSGITTLTTPWLIRAAEPAAAFIDRKLPRPLQTFAALYGAWLERLRATTAARRSAGMGRLVRLLVLDVVVLSALIVGVAVWLDAAAGALQRAFGIAPGSARALVIGIAGGVSLPLIVGIGRLAHRLGSTLAEAALPRQAGKADLDAVPRRSLVVTLQLGVALVTGVVVLAIAQPFLPSYSGALVLGALVVGFGVAIWRSAADLQSHVRAGAQAVVEALSRHARAGRVAADARPLAEIQALFSGLGAPVAVTLGADHSSIGRSLAELNLRGRTGASVLAISRSGESIVIPTAGERLQAGDVLALAGTHDAIQAAKDALLGATTERRAAPPSQS